MRRFESIDVDSMRFVSGLELMQMSPGLAKWFEAQPHWQSAGVHVDALINTTHPQNVGKTADEILTETCP